MTKGYNISGELEITLQDISKVINEDFTKYAFVNKACEYCSNNPKNGGSGICHCTLGLPKIKA